MTLIPKPINEKPVIISKLSQEESLLNQEHSKKLYTLQIILTNYCNLKCNYCYVQRDVVRSIPLEIAKEAISNMVLSHPPEDWMYTLCFMGGEPLSEFAKIQHICEWIWETYPNIDIQISSPTNGTLLNDDIRIWLRNNSQRFSLSLSYDGDSIQDYNRSNSASSIDTAFFRYLCSDQPFKMTISEYEVSYLASNIISLQERGYKIAANAACGEALWEMDSIREFGAQMLILAQYYADHPSIQPVDLIDIDIPLIFNHQDTMLRRCGIGCNYDTIDMDGKMYPCHLFSSLALKSSEIERAKTYQMGEREDFTISICEDCVLNPICPRCYGMSFLRFGDPFAVDKNLCLLFKQQIKGACSYNIKRMAKLGNLTRKDHIVLCAIKTIMNKLHFE